MILLPEIAQEVEIMLAELESNMLLVELIPQKIRTNEGGMIRCASSKNAQWYQSFCAMHASSRKRKSQNFDTRIRRKNTIRALEKLIAGVPVSKYTDDFLKIAANRVKRGAQQVYPNRYK